MNTLIVVASQSNGQNGWPNRYGVPFSALENLNEGVRIARNSFFPTHILLGGWKTHYNGSMVTVHSGMTRLVKEIYHDMASKVVEAVHPDFDWGETYGEYCYWESATIILTARNISASRVEIICNGLDHDYLFYMPIGFADYEVNNPWSKQLKVDYITHIAEVRLWV